MFYKVKNNNLNFYEHNLRDRNEYLNLDKII